MVINKLIIDFQNEVVKVNGKKVKKPVIVNVPVDDCFQKRFLFNNNTYFANPIPREMLPEISITLKNSGSLGVSDNGT